jgi:ABC-type nitrate/sulfonate/bicarbonate transport system permease component
MGLGDGPQIFMVALGALMVMATSTYSLASNAETRYILAAKSMGVDSVFMQTGIILPLIFPSLFAALRVAVAICFGIAVAAEYLGAQGGLGFLIRNARTTLNTETILLGIFAIGIEAWLVDWVVQLWAKAYSVWQDTSLSREQS